LTTGELFNPEWPDTLARTLELASAKYAGMAGNGSDE
jgi:hypothetical protein